LTPLYELDAKPSAEDAAILRSLMSVGTSQDVGLGGLPGDGVDGSFEDLALPTRHRRILPGGDLDECGGGRYAFRAIAVTACWRCVGHNPCNSVTARSGTPDQEACRRPLL
jgi:hypothetical protein